MRLSEDKKTIIKDLIVKNLSDISDISKIIIFGSFIISKQPNDIDIAILDSSGKDYFTLSAIYRKKLRPISEILPIDVIPIVKLEPDNKATIENDILMGEVIYEK